VLLTAGPGNPIRLWEADTGKLLRSCGEKRENTAAAIVLSPDGRTLAARTKNGDVSLWEVSTGKRLCQLGTNICALTFSRDDRMLLCTSEDPQIRVWDVLTAKEVRNQSLRNAAKAGRPSTALFSPDGKTLASIHDVNNTNVVYLWEVASGKELCRLHLGKGTIPPGAVAFSSDSRFLAVSSYTFSDDQPSDGAVHLWEVATGKEVRKWTPDKAGTCSVAFSPDGKLLATGSGFGPIRLWEAATGKELRRCQGYRAHVVALAFSPDGSTLASLGGLHDHTARLWEVASGKERVRASQGHVGPVLSVAFSADGKSVVSGGRDGLVGLWNSESGQERRRPLLAGDFQAVTALPADGKTFLTVGNSVSPNGQSLLHAIFQAPTQVCVWDTATGRKLRQFEGPATGVAQSLALSPDGQTLVLTSWRNVHLIEIATGKVMRTITDVWGNPPNKCAALSADGKTLAVFRSETADTGRVHFYATTTGKELSFIKAHRNVVCCLAFSPDGQTFAAGGVDKLPEGGDRPTIRLWHAQADTKEWKEAGTLVGHKGIVWGLTFSPDGKTLASASQDGSTRLWEVATGKQRRCFVGHGGEVWCLAFAPDGRRLATGGNDTTILVWDVTGRLQGGQLRPVKLSAHEVKSLWADLAGTDAARAGRAIWTLATAPAQALPLLREHLRSVAPSGPRIARLIVDLDSDTFAVRQRATDELAKLGEMAEPALRQALAKPDSLEVRRRLEQLLEPLKERAPLSGEELRACRALEVLGQMGTPEALPLLEELTRGAKEARLTLEAQAVLKWLRTQGEATKP
jgi:WD40 repeat protein